MTIVPAKSDEFEIQDILDALRSRSFVNSDDRQEFAQMMLKLGYSKDPIARKVIRYLGDQMSSYEEQKIKGGSMLTESVESLKAKSRKLFEVESDPAIDAMDQAVQEMDDEPKEDEFTLELDSEGAPVDPQPSGLEPSATDSTGNAGAAPAAPKPATERRELRTKFSLKAPIRYEKVYRKPAAK